MKTVLSISLINFFCFILFAQQSADKKINNVQIVNYTQLVEAINKEKDKLLVINFWATWCVPCIEELPEFIEINNKYKVQSNFKMLLVSLDRVKSISIVSKFIEKYSITPEVLVLDDIKTMNTWIPQIDSSWSGAIPATVIYKQGQKIFFKEDQMNKEELEKLIISNL